MPAIQSAVFFRNLVQVTVPRAGIFKYQITLEDGKAWLLYAVPSNGQDPQLKLVSNTQIQGIRYWNGMIQVSKNPIGPAGEAVYDASAGVYSSSAAVTASVTGSSAVYQLSWTKVGMMNGQPLLMYALPHHVQSFDSATASQKSSLRLQTTTKGIATAILADSWTLVENSLPTGISFAPWSHQLSRSTASLSAYAADIIKQVAKAEISQDINSQTYLNSMYFSGKALSKFAVIIYTINDLLQEPDLAALGLERLKKAFAKFVDNQQINPLVYDSSWGGIISSAFFKSRDPIDDFGNSLYNDHHFHYGNNIRPSPVRLYVLMKG